MFLGGSWDINPIKSFNSEFFSLLGTKGIWSMQWQQVLVQNDNTASRKKNLSFHVPPQYSHFASCAFSFSYPRKSRLHHTSPGVSFWLTLLEYSQLLIWPFLFFFYLKSSKSQLWILKADFWPVGEGLLFSTVIRVRDQDMKLEYGVSEITNLGADKRLLNLLGSQPMSNSEWWLNKHLHKDKYSSGKVSFGGQPVNENIIYRRTIQPDTLTGF